jgi:regulator of nonsense transcripts 1
VDSHEEYSGSGTSLVNTEEGKAIAHLVASFADSGIDSWDLGIITPYAGQVTYLLDSLASLTPGNEDFANGIEIDTVDAFQGREKEFIIFSCVRANEEGTIGFLSDKRRVNVALTRARYGLVVVGNASTFTKNDVWAGFIEYCQERHALVSGPIGEWQPVAFQREIAADVPDGDWDGEDDLA